MSKATFSVVRIKAGLYGIIETATGNRLELRGRGDKQVIWVARNGGYYELDDQGNETAPGSNGPSTWKTKTAATKIAARLHLPKVTQ